MKKIMTATALILAAGLAQAAPFDFQRDIGSQELDPSLGAVQVAQPQPSTRDVSIALYEVYRGTPEATDARFEFNGEIQPSDNIAKTAYELAIEGGDADPSV
jgi:hypothetical protein